jgi:hypothetical protein
MVTFIVYLNQNCACASHFTLKFHVPLGLTVTFYHTPFVSVRNFTLALRVTLHSPLDLEVKLHSPLDFRLKLHSPVDLRVKLHSSLDLSETSLTP